MVTDPDCIFCKIVAGAVPCFRLREDDETIAFMDINPVSEGHALVIHKVHHRDLYDIPGEHLAAVVRTAQTVARAIESVLRPDGLNLLQCNGPAAKQSVMHTHMHVILRRMNDGLTMNWELVQGDMDAIGALAGRIRARL